MPHTTKTTNLTETDLLEYFKNKRKAKTQLTQNPNLFIKMINGTQRTSTSISSFSRGGDTSLSLKKSDEFLGGFNTEVADPKRADSPRSSLSPSPTGNITNFTDRTNKLKKRLVKIRNKSLNQLSFAASLAANKKLYGESIAAVASSAKDARVVKEIRNMYETSLNKSDFNNNLEVLSVDNTANNSIIGNNATSTMTNNNANINAANSNLSRLMMTEDSDKTRCLFNISRNEIIDIEAKETELGLIKNSRCSYNNSRIDNERATKDEDLNVTSIIRELKENEFKESFKIEMEEMEDKR